MSCVEFRLKDGVRVMFYKELWWINGYLNCRNSVFLLIFSFGVCSVPPDVMQLCKRNPSENTKTMSPTIRLYHTPWLQGWLLRLSLHLLLQALPLITSTHPHSFHFPPMHVFNSGQHPKIIDHKQHPGNHHNSPAHNRRHPRRDTPHAALLTIHIRKCRYEPSKRIQTSRHEDLIQQPHEVGAPAPPEPDHPACADTTAYSRDHQELHVLDTVHDLGSRVRSVQFVGCAERGECSGEYDEAG
jgi:hypothetical protein